jgi:nucleoside phosphorylase
MREIDILLITALKEEQDAFIEAAAVTASGQGVLSWEECDSGTSTPYKFGRYIDRTGRKLNIALARPTRMGGISTSIVIGTLAERLKPQCLAMCGVCAGNPSTLALGDVVIAEMVYQYDEGKRKENTFEGDHRHIQIKDTWLRSAQEMKSLGLPSFGPVSPDEAKVWLLERLYANDDPIKHPARDRYFPSGTWGESLQNFLNDKVITFKGRTLKITAKGKGIVDKVYLLQTSPKTLPFEIKVGPMASGNVVVKDGITWDSLSTMGVRSTIGLEMEAAAIGGAAHRLDIPFWVVAKGVMDHADPNKEDRYKKFAARASADVLIQFLLNQFAKITVEQNKSTTLAKKVFVIGGITGETEYSEYEQANLAHACTELGKAIAISGADLLICSQFPDSADIHTAVAYSGNSGKNIHIHSPRHPTSIEKLNELKKMLGKNSTNFVEWYYPGPDDEKSWSPAWLLCQLQALEVADIVVAIGGRVSNTTSTLLHIAEARRIPIVPFEFLGGAAKRAFKRIDWLQTHPNIDVTMLSDKIGISKVMEIANKLIISNITNRPRIKQPKTFFVSRARLDAEFSEVLCHRLKESGLSPLLGDDQVRNDRMVQPAIEEAVLRSDVFIVLWSESYAKSRWCYDELDFALNRALSSDLQIWLFNLDGSDVVPVKARFLTEILARTPNALAEAAINLINQYKPAS